MNCRYKKLKGKGLMQCWEEYAIEKISEEYREATGEHWILKRYYKYFERVLIRLNENEEEVERIEYSDFAEITKAMFYRVSQYLILGEPFHLGNGNGILKARRIESSYEEKRWSKFGLTKEKEYWGGEDYCVLDWVQPPVDSPLLKEETKRILPRYCFVMARDNNGTGFKERFQSANKNNVNLKYGYDFIPSNNIF